MAQRKKKRLTHITGRFAVVVDSDGEVAVSDTFVVVAKISDTSILEEVETFGLSAIRTGYLFELTVAVPKDKAPKRTVLKPKKTVDMSEPAPEE